MTYFTFRRLAFKDVPTILGWLNKPHIQEFWDNSEEHHNDIGHFAEGRKTPASYHDGIYSYWLGAVDQDLFCMIMTSEMKYDSCPKVHQANLVPDKKTYGLDFCIGNVDYLGQGLGAPALKGFMQYFKENIDPNVYSFFIDPNQNNPCAKHVYEKAGFKIVGEFVAESGVFIGQKHDLLLKKA